MTTFKSMAHIRLLQSTRSQWRSPTAQQVGVSTNYQLLRFRSLASQSPRHGLSVISAFTSTLTHTCRCGRTSIEQCRGASLLSADSARSAERCQLTATFQILVLALVHSLLDYGNAVLQSASQPTCTWCVDCSRCSMRRQRGTTHLPPATIRPHHRCVGDTTLAARPRTRAVQDRSANVQSSAGQRATISGTSCCRRWPTWSACSSISKYQPPGHTAHQIVYCWQPCLSGCCSSSLE